MVRQNWKNSGSRWKASAIRIFAEAFQRDPEFFQFWRTMQAYREVFSTGESRMVLTPESDFFRYFREMPVRPAAAR